MPTYYPDPASRTEEGGQYSSQYTSRLELSTPDEHEGHGQADVVTGVIVQGLIDDINPNPVAKYEGFLSDSSSLSTMEK